MKKIDATKKRLYKEGLEMLSDLHSVAAVSKTTMRQFSTLCMPAIKELSALKIKNIRESAGVSQPVFAKIINVSIAAVKQWERGERKPSGAALKLLNLVAAKGLDAVI